MILLKQIIVFLNLVLRVCIYFIAWLQPSLIMELQRSEYCTQLIVWTLNITWITIEKSNLSKAILYHADISKRYF